MRPWETLDIDIDGLGDAPDLEANPAAARALLRLVQALVEVGEGSCRVPDLTSAPPIEEAAS